MAKKKKKKAKKKIVKKVTRRSRAKNSALDPKYTLKSRLELLDYDYLSKLNPKELAWLNKFSEEYIHASFEENPKDNLHTKKQELEIYQDNYARNSDVLMRKKVRKQLEYVGESELEKIEVDPIDYIIDLIDAKKR